MSENPLLPHRRLQELHALMVRSRALDRNHRKTSGISREAILSALAIQMESGDILCGEGGDSAVEALAAETPRPRAPKGTAGSQANHALSLPAGSQWTLCTGIAQGLQAARSRGVVAVLTSTHSADSNWKDLLAYAMSARLPLLLVCVDGGRGRRKDTGRSALSWPTITLASRHTRLPVLPVDAEDGVAVYRAIQESLLRARLGDGPTAIWGGFAAQNQAAGNTSRALQHMKKYLRVRGLKPLA